VELEPGPAALHDVELLVLARLVVLVDDPVAHLLARPGVDAERPDAEVGPHGTPRLAPVGDLVDLVQLCDAVPAHWRPPSARVAATYRAEYAQRGDDLFSLRSRDPRGPQVLLELRLAASARLPVLRCRQRSGRPLLRRVRHRTRGQAGCSGGRAGRAAA